MVFKYPCQDCKDRYLGCHSNCQKYLEAKAEHSKEKESVTQIKEDERRFDSYEIERRSKIKKRYNFLRKGQ